MELNLPLAVTSSTHSDRMSDKYVHINTGDVLSKFMDLGWSVSSASAARHSKTPEHARHLVRLRHPSFNDINLDGVTPELIILNSHNGSWALRIMLGMYRMACCNGIVAGSVWDGITLKHYNLKNLEDRVLESTQHMESLTNKLAGTVKDWVQVEVPYEDQSKLAEEAIRIRWGSKTPVTTDQLLEARRNEDRGSDLWHVFNRIQENLTQGGFTGRSSNGRNLRISTVRNVKRDFKFNNDLFQVATEYANKNIQG